MGIKEEGEVVELNSALDQLQSLGLAPFQVGHVVNLCGNQILRRVRAESSQRRLIQGTARRGDRPLDLRTASSEQNVPV